MIDKNAASSSSTSVDAVAAAKGKQSSVEASQFPSTEAEQAPHSPRSTMQEGRARMGHISHNVDNIVEAEMVRYRASLLTSPRTK